MHSADIFGGFLRRAGSSPLDGPNIQIEYHLFNDLLGNKQKGRLILNMGGVLDFSFLFIQTSLFGMGSVCLYRLIYLLGNKPFYSYYLGNDSFVTFNLEKASWRMSLNR